MMGVDDAIRIKWSHVGLRTWFLVYACVLACWSTFGLIDQFGNGLWHISFWLAYEIVFLAVGLLSVGYGLNAMKALPEVDTSLTTMVMWMTALALGKNITHMIFVAIELASGTSALAIANYWFLAAFEAILAILVVLDIAIFVHMIWYKRHLTKRKV